MRAAYARVQPDGSQVDNFSTLGEVLDAQLCA